MIFVTVQMNPPNIRHQGIIRFFNYQLIIIKTVNNDGVDENPALGQREPAHDRPYFDRISMSLTRSYLCRR